METELGLDTYLLFLRGLEEEADIQAVRVLDKFQDEQYASCSYEAKQKRLFAFVSF